MNLAETDADLLAGRHVLDTRPLALPTDGLASVALWDPHLVHDGDRWLVGYVSARRFFRFHPVLATGPSLDALTLLAEAGDRRATEGTTLVRVDDRLVGGGQRRTGRSARGAAGLPGVRPAAAAGRRAGGAVPLEPAVAEPRPRRPRAGCSSPSTVRPRAARCWATAPTGTWWCSEQPPGGWRPTPCEAPMASLARPRVRAGRARRAPCSRWSVGDLEQRPDHLPGLVDPRLHGAERDVEQLRRCRRTPAPGRRAAPAPRPAPGASRRSRRGRRAGRAATPRSRWWCAGRRGSAARRWCARRSAA